MIMESLEELYRRRDDLRKELEEVNKQISLAQAEMKTSIITEIKQDLKDYDGHQTKQTVSRLASQFKRLNELKDYEIRHDYEIVQIKKSLFSSLADYYVDRKDCESLAALLRTRAEGMDFEQEKTAFASALQTGKLQKTYKPQYILGGYDPYIAKMIELYSISDYKAGVSYSPKTKEVILGISVGEFGQPLQYVYRADEFVHEYGIYKDTCEYYDNIYAEQKHKEQEYSI